MSNAGNGIAQVWVNVAMGIVLLVLFPRLPQYVFAPDSFTWTFASANGAPLAYTDSAFFLIDVGVLTVAIGSLVLSAAYFVPAQMPRRVVGAGVGGGMAAVNGIVALWTWGDLGLQILPILGMAGGVYIAIVETSALVALGKGVART